MNLSHSDFVNLVNTATADLLLADKNDKSPLASIMDKMETFMNASGFPPALITMVKRIHRLAELIILDEAPYENGICQLSDGLKKIGTIVSGLTGDMVYTASCGDAAEKKVPDDLADLFCKFGQQLACTLDDFEMYVLEYEKGAKEALGEIRRFLHTWKGEFGVLDVGTYVRMIHELEEKIGGDSTITTDELLSVKDTLMYASERMRQGIVPVFQESPDDEKTSETIEPQVPCNEAKGEPESRDRDIVIVAENSEVEEYKDELGENADKGLLGDFVNEANDHIHNAETLLLELEVNPDKPDHINTIFRACHTIKGVASFLSLKTLTKVAHCTENLMDMIRKGELSLTPKRIDLLFEAMDCLREMVAAVAAVIEGHPYSVPESAAYIIRKLAQSEKEEESANQAAGIETKEKKVGELLVERGAASERQIENALKKQIDGDIRPIGEILIDQQVPPRMIAKALASQNKAKSAAEVEDTIRVPVKRLDQLIDAIGEGVIAQSMVYANSAVASLNDLALEKKIAQSMLIMRQIQEMSMSLRMVALRSTFQKMARLVRDLSKKVDKDVELILEGEDTELDKSVVENIGDPLIHMIRNALDHGIETVDERKMTDKPLKAKIFLRAYHKAGNVCIEIEDDGRGLNKDRIKNKAAERGLCKAGDMLSDQEIYQFIFMPGFSTAAMVTDISGRGVGMDVVHRNISALRGAVDIHSVEGKGTLFTIRLPLTLAIINGMIIRLGEERYIVPTLSIIESILPQKNQMETIVGKGEILKVRGELVRLIRLQEHFFGSGELKKSADSSGIALVVEDAMGRKVALFVDEIIDQQQVVIKNLGEGLGEIQGVSGGAIMSDGTISLILDVAGIVRSAS